MSLIAYYEQQVKGLYAALYYSLDHCHSEKDEKIREEIRNDALWLKEKVRILKKRKHGYGLAVGTASSNPSKKRRET